MAFRKSRHTAIYVLPERFSEAVGHYAAIFNKTGTPIGDGWEFSIDDQMVYIDRSSDGIERVVHEYVPVGDIDAEKTLLDRGCELYPINGDTRSTHGFYVKDPFGLILHVYTAGGDL